jgi:hypothetical protein|tara:strand:+ start:2209 stop:2445 length:237 start_codon:yes stop_codon:yes gene_type:complete
VESFEAQKQRLFAKMVYLKSAQQHIEGAENKEFNMATKKRLPIKGIRKSKNSSQNTNRRSLKVGSGCSGCRRSQKRGK